MENKVKEEVLIIKGKDEQIRGLMAIVKQQGDELNKLTTGQDYENKVIYIYIYIDQITIRASSTPKG